MGGRKRLVGEIGDSVEEYIYLSWSILTHPEENLTAINFLKKDA